MLKQLRFQDFFFFFLEKFLLQLGRLLLQSSRGQTGLSLLWGVSPMVCISEQLGVIDPLALGLQ